MKNIIKLIRPSHWVKNAFIFMPIFFGNELFNLHLLFNSIVVFFAFSFAASSIYCFNDIMDVEDDKRHPVKCARPIACNAISIKTAYIVTFSLAILSVLLPLCVPLYDNTGMSTALVIVGYWVMELAYCTKLKRIVIIDICILSLGFVFRIFAGGVATGIVISHWLVMMTFLLTLFMGVAKRRDDVLRMITTGIPPRLNTKRYNLSFVNEALTITGGVMLVCYIMYTVSPEVMANFNTSHLYITSTFVLLGLLRYMQLAIVDEKSGDPTKVLLHDHMTQCIVIAWILTFLLIIYI